MAADVVTDLTDALGTDVVVTDPDVTDSYRRDRAMTVAGGTPAAVVRARTTDDVSATLRIASTHGVPVVPRGAGTGLSGGSSALDGSITLSTERMRALRVEPDAMLAVVGPGLLNVEVKAAAAEHGLWYPPDPSSFEICSIGGNLATNAGGLCCVRYGVTTDYVLGLEVVLADGTVLRLGGRTVKDVAGYDLKRLFVGSEGTLGIVTEATLRLRPRPPAVATVVASFPGVVEAGRAVARIAATLRPSALELMDAAAVDAVERVKPMGLDAGVGALVLVQVDAPSGSSGDEPSAAEPSGDEPFGDEPFGDEPFGDEPFGDEAARATGICEASGATYVAASTDADEGELLMGARRMAIPCVERLGTVLIEDIGVPLARIPDLLGAVAEVAARRDTLIPVIGHAGDGNFHPLVTFDATDPDATARAEAAFDEIMDIALALGGTVTGEHGIGTLKARHLADQLGPDVLEVTRRIKAALDPAGILNPGKWV